MSAAPMSAYDADYSPADPREGVSAEQQAVILGIEDLTDAEKAKALDTLSDVATGDVWWPHAEERMAEEFGDLYGLAQGSDGLWRNAMVQDKDGAWVFDPASVR